MAPKSSPLPSSMPSSQKSKQQSISAFFRAKPTVTKPPVSPGPAVQPPENPTTASTRGDKHNVAAAHTSPIRKRVLDPVEDEADEEPVASPKRARLDEPQHSLPRGSASGFDKSCFGHRASKYSFPSSPVLAADNENITDDDDNTLAAKKRRAELHAKFVQKLGRPDSFAELRRRRRADPFEEEAAEDVEDEGQHEEGPRVKSGKKDTKKPRKLTPMEMQYLEIKRKHLDTIIVYEVGYKFQIYGEDARLAAKELGIVCIPGKFRYDEHVSEAHLNRFASASFPVHRLQVHVKRLVQANHKVGVVRQLETAALKAAGDNRNAPFVRKLTNLYTKGTYVDDIEGIDSNASVGAQSTGYLLCMTETNAKGCGTDEKVHIGLVAVQPATGDIIYDDFEDGFMRSEIETRFLHIAPAEFLIVGTLSKASEKLVQHLSASKANVLGDKARVERIEKPKTVAAQSYSHISNFYAEKMKTARGTSEEQDTILDQVHQLSEHVTICLSALITYLTDYGLEHVFDLYVLPVLQWPVSLASHGQETAELGFSYDSSSSKLLVPCAGRTVKCEP